MTLPCGHNNHFRFRPQGHTRVRQRSSLAHGQPHGYLVAMRRTGIAELKNRLSYYLRHVRRGESILVYDRERPIARIDPVQDSTLHDPKDRTAALERSGVLRAPVSKLGEDWLGKRVQVDCDVVSALLSERNEGR
jgi:antitoxin (DNA-binding transcriptional repressor) of toxin-antitoxin stability system